MVVAALLLAVGMMGGAFLLSQADFAPKVNVTSGATNPNVYVSSTPPDHAISVMASADRKVAPDLLEIDFRVQTQSDNAKDSQARNAVVASQLKSGVEALGINDSEITTTSYSVQPVYTSNYLCDKNNNNCYYQSNVTGYQTVQSIAVDVYQLDQGGAIIDAASNAGNNETFVDSTSFMLKPETQAMVAKELLNEAAGDAKAKAQSIADGLGISVGKVLSASENTYTPTPYYNSFKDMAMPGGAVPAATQLSPGQLDVSASVSVSYEVGS